MRAPMLITAFLLSIAIPVAVQAGEARAVAQVGFLSAVRSTDYDKAKDPLWAAFKDGLQALGYVEGKNIHLELLVPKKPEDLAEMAADLVNRKVDIIATTGPQPIEAARRATATIPIVIIACDRADRLVNSIARPGGNITGMACISSDLALKRLQLMQQVLPGLTRLAVLFNGGAPQKVAELQDITAAAKTLEVEVHPADVRDASGFTTAFAAIKAVNPDGLLILASL
jgi:putative tryptophan/tyrosine transport system substrate-binding protein